MVDTSAPSPEQQATISKRLLVGGAITAGMVAFALVPTKDLRLKPSKPLFFYITQLLSAQVNPSAGSGGRSGLTVNDRGWHITLFRP